MLSRSAAPWVELLRARGFAVETPYVPSALAEASLDLVVVADSLEHLQWDRWALQQIHRSLVDGGHLALAVPSFHALTSPADVAFLGVRAAREISRRARRGFGLGAPRERFRGRRYRLAALDETLASLGFTVTQRSAHDLGWLAPLAPMAKRWARTHVLMCERMPSLFGEGRRPYPDPDSHRHAFERTHVVHLKERNEWLERHPRMRPDGARAFDPAAYGGRNVLVLAPHPDDELVGCGGTLAKLAANGAKVTVVHATDGSEAASLWHAPEATRRTVRLEEARRVAAMLGFEPPVFWGEDNAAFRERDERVRELADLLARLRPALVFVPFVTDVHPDHRVIARMLARAIGAAGALDATQVLCYQVWGLAPANLYCDVTDMASTQERALWLYETAMKVDDYVHFCQDRNYQDAVALMGRPGLVEAYYAVPALGYPELAATIEGPNA